MAQCDRSEDPASEGNGYQFPVETVNTGADKAKLAAAGVAAASARVVAFYLLGRQDLWLRVVALLALMVAGRRRRSSRRSRASS